MIYSSCQVRQKYDSGMRGVGCGHSHWTFIIYIPFIKFFSKKGFSGLSLPLKMVKICHFTPIRIANLTLGLPSTWFGVVELVWNVTGVEG